MLLCWRCILTCPGGQKSGHVTALPGHFDTEWRYDASTPIEDAMPKMPTASPMPATVFLEILYGCNLSCGYCYVGQERNHEKPVVPPFETTRDILNILSDHGVTEVVLLGGEPTLHPQIERICAHVGKLSFAHRGIVTNGTHITSSIAEALAENSFWVDITFRGPDAAVFDCLAGRPGAYASARASAVLLTELGIPLGMEFDCTRQNYMGLYETVADVIRAGAKPRQLQLHRILPAGDAATSMDRFALSSSQFRDVFEQASRIQDDYDIRVVFEDGFPFCLVDSRHWDMIAPCACGYTLLTIDPIGEARYCSCHSASLGNVLTDSLTTIWTDHLTEYRAAQSRFPEACKECDVADVCKGGCSASGGRPSLDGCDIFEDELKPIKLDGRSRPTALRICGQSLVD